MLRFSKITYGGMMTMQINTVEVKFNIVDRYWSSVLKRDWYAVLECQTSTVNRYNTSSITDAFHQQLMRSEFSALQLTKNHSLFMCSCILCCWFYDYSFLVLLLTLLTNYQGRNIALRAKCLFVWLNKNLWWLNNMIYIHSIPVLYTHYSSEVTQSLLILLSTGQGSRSRSILKSKNVFC